MLENIDILEYYNHGYKNLVLSLDLTCLLCVKI